MIWSLAPFLVRIPRVHLSLMTYFADINVSQCSVATHARWDFNMNLTANLLRNLPVKKFVNRLRFDRIVLVSVGLMSVAPFFVPRCI